MNFHQNRNMKVEGKADNSEEDARGTVESGESLDDREERTAEERMDQGELVKGIVSVHKQ